MPRDLWAKAAGKQKARQVRYLIATRQADPEELVVNDTIAKINARSRNTALKSHSVHQVEETSKIKPATPRPPAKGFEICQLCHASVKIANMNKHLQKIHRIALRAIAAKKISVPKPSLTTSPQLGNPKIQPRNAGNSNKTRCRLCHAILNIKSLSTHLLRCHGKIETT